MAAVTSKTIRSIGNGYFASFSSGTTSMNISISSTVTWDLRDVRFTLTTGPGEASTFLVNISSTHWSKPHTYRASSQNINTLRSFRYAPSPPLVLGAQDVARITWTNKTTEKWGLQVVGSKRQ